MRTRVYGSALALVLGAGLLVAAALAGEAAPSGTREDARRGGTLRVDRFGDFDFLDPALAYFAGSWQLGFVTNCKLLNFPDKEARDGGMSIIPEVAERLPAISRDGKTYTFALRRTYRLSNGSRVTAQNFVYAMNRALNPKMASPATTFMSDIVGAQAVVAGRATRATGVTAIGPYRLRIKLRRAAPDFLARVTMPFFAAVAVGTPIVDSGVGAPLPSCGPYFLAEWNKGRSARLERNRYYRGPRPANPDRIVFNIGISVPAQRLRCERGETDICVVAPAAAAELRDKYGVNRARFFVKNNPVFWFLDMNQEQPLFRNNAPLRRAVNYAIDRPHMVRQHGALGGRRTDQILPYGFPGFRDWQLYPLKGADVARARSIARGHLRSGKARFWTFNSLFGSDVAQVVQFNLRQIGLETEISTFDIIVLSDKAGERGAQFDLKLSGWAQDYPDPYDFINVLLDGTTLRPAHNNNQSYFDSPVWNRRMRQTARLLGAERLRAYGLLDRDLMKGPAPIAPYITTNSRTFVSAQVGCFTYHAIYGADFAALCLK